MSLRDELLLTLNSIDRQIAHVEATAKDMGISPHPMRDASGAFVLAPLLVAKAQLLHALVLV